MDAKAVVNEFFARGSRRDESAFELISPDFAQHATGLQGRDGFRQTAATLDHDLDNPAFDVQRVIAEDDLVTVQLTLRGRHVASTMPLLAGITPTGGEIAWSFIHIFRVTDGLIAEHWACRDDLGLLVQLGAWPPTAVPSKTP